MGQAGGALPRGEEDRMLAEVRCPRLCTDREQERVVRDGQGARRVPGEGGWGQEPRGKNPNRSISSHHQEDGREGENQGNLLGMMAVETSYDYRVFRTWAKIVFYLV